MFFLSGKITLNSNLFVFKLNEAFYFVLFFTILKGIKDVFLVMDDGAIKKTLVGKNKEEKDGRENCVINF